MPMPHFIRFVVLTIGGFLVGLLIPLTINRCGRAPSSVQATATHDSQATPPSLVDARPVDPPILTKRLPRTGPARVFRLTTKPPAAIDSYSESEKRRLEDFFRDAHLTETQWQLFAGDLVELSSMLESVHSDNRARLPDDAMAPDDVIDAAHQLGVEFTTRYRRYLTAAQVARFERDFVPDSTSLLYLQEAYRLFEPVAS